MHGLKAPNPHLQPHAHQYIKSEHRFPRDGENKGEQLPRKLLSRHTHSMVRANCTSDIIATEDTANREKTWRSRADDGLAPGTPEGPHKSERERQFRLKMRKEP